MPSSAQTKTPAPSPSALRVFGYVECLPPSPLPSNAPSYLPSPIQCPLLISPLPFPTPSPLPRRDNTATRLTPHTHCSRHPYLTFAGLAVFSAVLGARHMRNSLRDNDLAQKNSSSSNYYVTVERSGGGI